MKTIKNIKFSGEKAIYKFDDELKLIIRDFRTLVCPDKEIAKGISTLLTMDGISALYTSDSCICIDSTHYRFRSSDQGVVLVYVGFIQTLGIVDENNNLIHKII